MSFLGAVVIKQNSPAGAWRLERLFFIIYWQNTFLCTPTWSHNLDLVLQNCLSLTCLYWIVCCFSTLLQFFTVVLNCSPGLLCVHRISFLIPSSKHILCFMQLVTNKILDFFQTQKRQLPLESFWFESTLLITVALHVSHSNSIYILLPISCKTMSKLPLSQCIWYLHYSPGQLPFYRKKHVLHWKLELEIAC